MKSFKGQNVIMQKVYMQSMGKDYFCQKRNMIGARVDLGTQRACVELC